MEGGVGGAAGLYSGATVGALSSVRDIYKNRYQISTSTITSHILKAGKRTVIGATAGLALGVTGGLYASYQFNQSIK